MRFLRRSGPSDIHWLVRLAVAIPWLTMFLSTSLALVAVWYTATQLEFETSRNALVSADAPYIKRYNELKADFHNLDPILVVIEAPQVQRGKQFVDALAARLRTDTTHFARVIDKIDFSSLEEKKLLYLAPADLQTLKQRLQDSQDLITAVAETPGLRQFLASLNQEISKALVSHLTTGLLGPAGTSATSDQAGEQGPDVTFLTALFVEIERALASPMSYAFRSPLDSFFLPSGKSLARDGYLTSKQERFLFVLVEDRTTGGGFVKHAASLQALRAHLHALQPAFPEVQAGVTGGKALANDEMLASQRDTTIATLLALGSVALLFIITFRERRRPLLVVTSLVFAICWTLGFATLTVGHLNILSVTFTPILIGLGIDYGIHLLARYSEARAQGEAFLPALSAAYQQTGPGVVAAALTTALAFYAVLLADFRGLAELGFIAGCGVLLCLLASYTVLPALLALSERHRSVRPGIWKGAPRNYLSLFGRFPLSALTAVGLLTLAGVVWLPMPGFDYNLLNLQAQGTESVLWEHRLFADAGRSSWYALTTADSLEQLRQKKDRFAALPAVERIESLAAVIPENQDERLALIAKLAPYVEPVTGNWEELEPIDVNEIATVLGKIRFKLQRPDTAWNPQQRPTETALAEARAALLALQERLNTTAPAVAHQALETFQHTLMTDFAAKLALLQRNVHPTVIGIDDLPNYLRDRYISASGRYLLQIFARQNIWERDPMATFVTQLQTTDAEITGPPVVAFHSIQQMQRGYVRGGLYAFVVIVGITLVLFRRVGPTLLALVPLFLGALWTATLMALFNVQFNLANLVVLPLFLGIAVDNGIHLVHRTLEDPTSAIAPLSRSTGKAILLSSLTTMLGFGSLMVAHHTGIFSLGLLLTLAMGSCLIATFVVLPLILQLWPPVHPSSISGSAPPTIPSSQAPSRS